MLKKTIKILLVILLSFCLCSCRKQEINNYIVPKYSHYNPNNLYDYLKQIEYAAENGNENQVTILYEKIYDELVKFEDMYVVISLYSDIDYTNGYYQKEIQYIYGLGQDLEDQISNTLHNVAISSCGNTLKQAINNDYVFDKYVDYKAKSNELIELYRQENILCEEYESLDYEDKNYSSKARDIFVKLVKIRDSIAHLEGYDNYNDFCDAEIYGRDYNPNDLKPIYKACKRFGTKNDELYQYCLDNLGEYDSANLLNDLYTCIEDIDYCKDTYEFFKDNEMYYLSDSNKSLDVAYTTSFYTNGYPFIYAYLYDDAKSLPTMIHEFGHFTNMMFDPEPYPLFYSGCYDIFEIHSTALQLLSTKKLNDNNLAAYNVSDLITYVTDGAIFDEWQRYIYENPNMSIEEIDEWYVDLMEEYGYRKEDLNLDYWTYINHNFSSPLYYVSYATSALASLQLFELSLTNYDDAVYKYEQIIKIGGYKQGYEQLMKTVGLKYFDNENNVYHVLDSAYNYCTELVY